MAGGGVGSRDYHLAAMAGNREFDQDRFKQLVLYVAWATRDDQRFGRTKLAKTLFYVDFDAYATEGKSVTGARYEHWEHGPFPPVLYRVEEELEREGLAERLPPLQKGLEIKLRVVQEPKLRDLDWGRHSADAIIRQLAPLPSWRVEDESHEHPGWRVTRMFQEIPYRTVHIDAKGPTAADVARGEEVAREHGWT